MRRTDIEMTERLKSFLDFDLGHMDESKFNNKVLDVNYYKDVNLDIYYPDDKKDKYPVFLIIYGGGWISGFKRDKFIEPMLKPLKHGYACVVCDYTLGLDETFPRAIIDIKMAIDFIHKNSDKYHFDDHNITIWGESAGGHLALEAALVPNEHLSLDNINSSLKNMVIFYPLVNCATVDNYESSLGKHIDPNSVFGVFMGEHLYDEKSLYLASPINFINEGMPNLWLQHGLNDKLVPYEQSVEIIEKMKAYPNVRFSYELAENKEHTDPYFFSDENVERIVNFIEL